MLQNRNKTYHDVRGSKIKCINYQKCPLCYGCRRYSSIDPECRKCYEENKKFNICNKDLCLYIVYIERRIQICI